MQILLIFLIYLFAKINNFFSNREFDCYFFKENFINFNISLILFKRIKNLKFIF